MLALLATVALGNDANAPIEAQLFVAEATRPDVPVEKPFKAIVLAQGRGAFTNMVSTNPFLDGQVLGRLGGTNGIVVDPEAFSAYTEQRGVGFFTWRPDVLDRKVGFNSAFEVDFAWGDRAYGTGGNTGGGLGGDQVNVQTRRLHVDIHERIGARDRHFVHLVAGLQFVADSSSNPNATTPDGLFRSGGGLMFIGSEASGLSLYGSLHDGFGERLRYRLGTYTLVEGGLGTPDDAWLAMADATGVLGQAIEVGGHAWLLRDRTGGNGGLLGNGPSSGLSEMQGGPRLNPYGDDPRPDEDAGVDTTVVSLAADIGINQALRDGPVGFRAIALGQLGSLDARGVRTVPITGLFLDAEARLRYAAGKGSILKVEGLYSSGDDGDDTNGYTGIITGNSYGFAAAIPNTHDMRILFSDPQSINRMVAAVYDVSGAGGGVIAGTASLGYDLIPNKLNVKAAGGLALDAEGAGIGTEVNTVVRYEPYPFFTTSVVGAMMLPGPEALVEETAYAGYLEFNWLAF
jgi:hypothetical protein